MHGFGYRFKAHAVEFLRCCVVFAVGLPLLLSSLNNDGPTHTHYTANTTGGGQFFCLFFFFASFHSFMVYVRVRNVLLIRMYAQIQTVNGVDLSPALFFSK